MYKDKEAQQEANRLAAQRRRERVKGMTQGMTKPQGMTQQNVIPEYPAIVEALCDPVKRNRLERINRELQAKGLGTGITYGWQGPDFNQVDSMLRATA